MKNKLDAIPENENVVLDFSMCNFVDHTVMEGVEGYVDTFDKKGGSIEIIGLDKHGADSEHPFAIRKVLPFAALVPVEGNLTKRQLLLQETATDFKWEYLPKKNKTTSFLSDFIFFRSREISYYYKHIRAKDKMDELMDVEFTEGAFIAREVVKATVMHIRLDREVPIFTLDKDGLIKYIYSLAGFRDISIPNHYKSLQ